VEADVSCRSVCAPTIGRGREEEAFSLLVHTLLAAVSACLRVCGVCAVDLYYCCCCCWVLFKVHVHVYMYVCARHRMHRCVSRACAIALTYRQDM